MKDKKLVIAENTAKRRIPEALEKHSWKKGQSGNPAGKPLGSRHKLSEAFMSKLHNDFLANGETVIERVRIEEPAQYLRVIASIVPKDITLNEGETAIERILNAINDEQLDEFVEGVRLLTSATTGGKGKAAKATQARPDSVH